MKQRLLKTMLLVAGLLLGANVAWADPTTLYERGTTNSWSTDDLSSWSASATDNNFAYEINGGLYLGNKAPGTWKSSFSSTKALSPTANSVVKMTAVVSMGMAANRNSSYDYIKIGGAEFRVYGTGGASNAPIAQVYIDNVAQGEAVSAVRGGNYTFTVEIDQATNAVKYSVSGSSTIDEAATTTNVAISNVVVGHLRGGSEGGSGCYITLSNINITEVIQTVTKAPYTINYKNGEEIVKTVSAEIAVGTVVNVETTVWKDAKKYILSAGEPTSLTVESGSENVLNVKVEEAAIYTYKVNAKDGETIVKEIGNGSTYAGEEVTFGYPQYVLADGKLYAMTTSTPDWYRTTFTPTATDFNVDLNVTGTPVDNVVFYSEAEDITGMTAADFTNRASKGQVARTADIDTYVDVTTLAPGKYKIFVRGLNGNSGARAFKAKVGETVVWDNWSIANGTNQLGNSEYFDVAESANLSIACEGSSASGLDWIYVVEAPKYKYTVNFVNGESAALKDPIQLEGYEGAAAAITDDLKAKFDKDGVIYAYASDDAAEKTIAADGNTVVTIMFAVDTHFTEPMLTFQGRAGEEVSLTFGAWNTEDYYGVDFGDGTIQKAKVGIDNKGPKKEDGTTGSATMFTGTVGADGIIKVYGENDVWYLVSSGAMPTTLDQEKLKNVVQLKISGANVESVELPAYPKMTQFEFNNSPVKTLDVTKVTTLTSLSVDNTTQSQYAPALESIDLSANTELTYLKILGNATNKGKLAAIDLSKNTKLANVYLQDNAIKTAVMPEGAALTFLNLQNNELETIDLSVCASNKDVYLNNNKLKSATLGVITKSCKLENNAFTLATLPAQPAGLSSSSKTKKFTYAPQAALQVADLFLVNDELDLSAQATVAKGELGKDGDYSTWYENVATVFTVKTAGETPATLVEGTDYNIAGGKITFLKAQDAKVYVEMTNEALPKFDSAPFKTTEFTVVQDFFGEKLAAAMAAPVEKVATLTLDADYEVLFPVNVPLGTQLVIDGANHTLTLGAETNFVLNDNLTLKNTKVDATKLTKPFVALTAEPAEGTKKNQDVYADAAAKDFNLLNAVTIDNVMVKNLSNALISANGQAWALENLNVSNSILQLNNSNKTFIDFYAAKDNKGAVKNINFDSNTLYNINENGAAYFIRFMNASNAQGAFGSKGDTGTTEYHWSFTKNTMINTFKGQNFGNNTTNNKKVFVTMTQNIFYDVMGITKFAQGNCIKTIENNITWGDVRAEEAIATASDPGFTAPTTALDLAAENGGIDLKLGASTLAAKWQAGDPRWAVTFAGYTVTAVNTEGLEIVPETTPAAVGEKVYASYTLTAGYDLEQPEFVDDNGAAIAFAEGQMGLEKVGDVEKMWFIMPAKNVTIKAHASKLYKITLNLSQEGGQATCLSVNKEDESTSYKKEGKVIYLAIEPATNYEAEISVMAGETKVDVVAETGMYSEQAYTHKFTMPAEAVTVTVTFKQTTGIQSVKAADLNDAVIYNLNGARVSKAGKGLYIINGKKVVIK